MTITGQAARLAHQERRRRWVERMGGQDSPHYRTLYAEAFEFAGPDHLSEYLDLAQQIDEDYAAHKRAQAAARVRAAVARRRIELAASAALERATEIRLAADDLLSDPRLAADPDFSTAPERSRAEVEADLRYAVGLASRAPDAYREMLPATGDLARLIGLRLCGPRSAATSCSSRSTRPSCRARRIPAPWRRGFPAARTRSPRR